MEEVSPRPSGPAGGHQEAFNSALFTAAGWIVLPHAVDNDSFVNLMPKIQFRFSNGCKRHHPQRGINSAPEPFGN